MRTAAGSRAAYTKQAMRDKLIEHQQYICTHGQDMPEIRHWQWGQPGAATGRPGQQVGRITVA